MSSNNFFVNNNNKQLFINGKTYDEPFAVHKDKAEFRGLKDIFREFYNTEITDEEYQQKWQSGEFYRNKALYPTARDNFGPVVVPEGSYFMMGDNRDNSDDSRFWGPLPRSYVIGTPIMYYFSFDKGKPLWKIWEVIRWNRILRPVNWPTYSY